MEESPVRPPFLFVLLVSLLLAGCGGGGSSATLSAGASPVLGLTQASLVAQSITDPDLVVTSNTTEYDLRRGVPDPAGPTLALKFPSPSQRLASGLNYAGVAVSGQGFPGPTLVQPAPDVLAAWNQGWTGKGTSILLIDGYDSRTSCANASDCHGITTMMITDLVAPGATKLGLDWQLKSDAIKMDGTLLSLPVTPSVVNLSFSAWSTGTTTMMNYLTGSSIHSNLTLTSAVLVKSAGNGFAKDAYSAVASDTLVKALVDTQSTVKRLLIVGALDKQGSTAIPANLASYSNIAGATEAARDRFVLANGRPPYANGGVSMNGNAIAGYESNLGTSYAAPVVAGYAAVIMSKFPNLNAEKTSAIILDTARYDTLSCYPSCNPQIYGRGEASLSRALAPVGRLR